MSHEMDGSLKLCHRFCTATVQRQRLKLIIQLSRGTAAAAEANPATAEQATTFVLFPQVFSLPLQC